MNPLLELARRRLAGRNVIAVMSGKGGVGKSVVAALLALALPDAALVDLDLSGMSIPRLLGVGGRHQVDRDGIRPLAVGDLRVFSLAGVVGEHYVVLPGPSQAGVAESLLAFADLGDARNVVVDMPPGMGEELLTLSRAARFKPVVVTTPSSASLAVVLRLLQYLGDMGLKPRAAVINMARLGELTPFGDPQPARKAVEPHADLVAEVPLDPRLEGYVGRLAEYRGPVYRALEDLARRL